jgi:tRNA 2-thiouridine synthesizing protein A
MTVLFNGQTPPNPECLPFMNTESIAHDDLWDAGDLGCGELVIHLRTKLRGMPGKVLKLVARDPGAHADIPAYCRMTGNQLLRQEPENASYWIQAKVLPK